MRKTAHRLKFVSLLLIVGMFLSAPRSSATDSHSSREEISLREYIAELRTATSVLDSESPTTIRSFRQSLPSEWIVHTDDQLFTIKTDWLATALLMEETGPLSNTERLRQTRQHLNGLLESAVALLTPPAGAELAQAQARADRILRGREFQGSHELSWLDKIKARVYAWISRQLEKLFGRMGISTSVGNAIAWIVVTLMAILLTFWVVRSMLAAAARPDLDLHGAAPAGHDWRYWAGEARSAAGRGDYRAAIHAAYWTAVAQLEENHLLPGDRSRTPRESLRLLEQGSDAYAPMEHLTRRFELTWYGYRAATPADWNDAVKQLETLECLRSSTRAIASSS